MSLERHTGNLIFLRRRNAACAITTMAILHQLSGKNLFTGWRGGTCENFWVYWYFPRHGVIGIPAEAAVITITDQSFGLTTPSGSPLAGPLALWRALTVHLRGCRQFGELQRCGDDVHHNRCEDRERLRFRSICGSPVQFRKRLRSDQLLERIWRQTETITLKSGILGQVFGLLYRLIGYLQHASVLFR